MLAAINKENCKRIMLKFTGSIALESSYLGNMTAPILRLPWDPGGLNWYRLEDKPNFMGEGLSATCPYEAVSGLPSWAVACLEPDGERTSKHIYHKIARRDLAWNGTDWTAASAEGLAWLVLRVCLVFFFFP